MRRAALRFLAQALAALLFASAAPVMAGAPAKPAPRITVGVPEGFETLLEKQHGVVDLWFGGRRVGEAVAEFGSGELRFADPAAVVAKLDGLADRAAVLAALSAPALADHASLVCRGEAQRDTCGTLRPDIAGIVFDAARYRVDLFVNPRLLTIRAARARDYLPPPPAGLSLINAMGFTLAGTTGDAPQYAVTDEAVVAVGPARLRAGLSYASQGSARADTLAAEIDGRGLRWSAGVLWAPGDELLGRRRLLGASVGTQLDTRLDRDQLEGTPLVVFLDGRSRVDVLVDGRIAASGIYEAGNQAIDTASLPEGSYDVVLRITGAGGAARTERRLFSRTRRLPPLGSDAWQVHAGILLDDTAGGLIGRATGTPIVEAGWAHRLSPALAIDLGAMGTDQRQLARVGATLLTRHFQVESGALLSARGDYGLVARAASRGGGRLAFDFEGRLVHSRDGTPLLPEPRYRPVTLDQATSFAPLGTYGQVTGSVSWQHGGWRFAAAGSWRQGGDYAVGPSFIVPVLRRPGFELVARGDYAFTNRGRSGFIGLSLVVTGRRTALSAETGLREQCEGGRDRVVPVGLVRATVQRSGADDRQLQATATLGRDDGSAYAGAEVLASSRLGSASGSVLVPFGGGGTQYALSLRTSLAAAGAGMRLGAANGESAVVAAVRGAEPDDRFDVLVNDVPLARISGSGKAVVSLPSYRTYDVRIRATGAGISRYDTGVRRVALYPGSVAGLRWIAGQAIAVSARLVDPTGAPLARAELSSGANLAQSDDDGSFVIELDERRLLTARTTDGRTCTLPVRADLRASNGFAALGPLTCLGNGSTPLASAGAKH